MPKEWINLPCFQGLSLSLVMFFWSVMGATAHLQSCWKPGGSAVLDLGEAGVISRLSWKGLESCEIWGVLTFEVSFCCVLALLSFLAFYA